MNYQETLDYLFSQLAVYQRDGAKAYKPGLRTSVLLAEAFDNPQNEFRSIHIAGTNGKGSTAHSLAAVLQKAGYRTGLYTSPHLVDFRERIRVNGEKISQDGVISFMERYFSMNIDLHPSFFELTMMMAFDWFRSQKVDVAVIETGLGGRLDSTNIISPVLSIITNISLDHTQFLGHTEPEIAFEKAGIIKRDTPVIVGEASGKVLDVFLNKSAEMNAPLFIAEKNSSILSITAENDSQIYQTSDFGTICSNLTGECQKKNMDTILNAIKVLRERGFSIPNQSVSEGLSQVCILTGLMGRWMILQKNPVVIADTGHNCGGWEYTVRRLNSLPGTKRLVIGFVNDKDISGILQLISRIKNCFVYPTQPRINRALPAEKLASMAEKKNLEVVAVSSTVPEAYKKALADSDESDTVFIGGSNFVVADLLEISSLPQ